MLTTETLLQEVLAKQVRLVEDLLTVAYQETEALKIDDLVRLTELTEEQQNLAEKLQALEEQRIGYLANYKKVNGLDAEPTLRELIANATLSEEFRQIAQALWEKYQQLMDQNELNGMLLKQSLQYTQKMLGALNYGATYQPDGRLEQVQASSSLVDKSV